MGDQGESNTGHATFAETCAENLSINTRRQYSARFKHFLEHVRLERDVSHDEMAAMGLGDITLDKYESFFERVQVKRVKVLRPAYRRILCVRVGHATRPPGPGRTLR